MSQRRLSIRTNERPRRILGIGVLEGLKIGPFKAILAHEYGRAGRGLSRPFPAAAID